MTLSSNAVLTLSFFNFASNLVFRDFFLRIWIFFNKKSNQVIKFRNSTLLCNNVFSILISVHMWNCNFINKNKIISYESWVVTQNYQFWVISCDTKSIETHHLIAFVQFFGGKCQFYQCKKVAWIVSFNRIFGLFSALKTNIKTVYQPYSRNNKCKQCNLTVHIENVVNKSCFFSSISCECK